MFVQREKSIKLFGNFVWKKLFGKLTITSADAARDGSLRLGFSPLGPLELVKSDSQTPELLACCPDEPLWDRVRLFLEET